MIPIRRVPSRSKLFELVDEQLQKFKDDDARTETALWLVDKLLDEYDKGGAYDTAHRQPAQHPAYLAQLRAEHDDGLHCSAHEHCPTCIETA